jgi:DNA-binding IclR family transcriptional regulator
MVYVETTRGHDAVAFRPDIGALLPLLASAMGRAWLAQAASHGDERGAAVLEALRRHDAAAWLRYQPAWVQAQRDYAESGYCIGEGDWHADVHAVAVPLRRPVDGEVLVFNCGVPTRRLRGDELRTRIGPHLLTLVARMEKALARQEGAEPSDDGLEAKTETQIEAKAEAQTEARAVARADTRAHHKRTNDR